jgi:hypothetical protein
MIEIAKPTLGSAIALLMTVAFATQTAWAVPAFFTDRVTFQAAAGTLVTESLDTFTTGGNSTAQPTGVTLTGGGGAGGFDTSGSVIFISEGTTSLQLDDWNAGATMTFDFAGPVVAFGVDFLDNSGPFDMDLIVNGVSSNFFSNQDQSMIGNGPLFLGVIDPASFAQALIASNSNNSGVNFDFIQFEEASEGGTAVPEPGALALFGIGLVGLRVMRRRRKLN